jgi:hypothetical protein
MLVGGGRELPQPLTAAALAGHALPNREDPQLRLRALQLLLLPKSFNASYGDLPYDEKLPHYNSQNLLARSLHRSSYDHNPGFRKYIEGTGVPFKPHEYFKRADLDQRQTLYREIAEGI